MGAGGLVSNSLASSIGVDAVEAFVMYILRAAATSGALSPGIGGETCAGAGVGAVRALPKMPLALLLLLLMR